MKRLFVAVDPDADTRAAIGRLSAAVRPFLPPASWVATDRLHVTVEFLGEVDPAVEARAVRALSEPFPVEAFTLTFGGLGLFPPTGAPRVLWLGIDRGLGELSRLHGLVRRRLGRADGARGAFSPHITLARFRGRVGRPHAEAVVARAVSAGPCTIDRVTLYHSRLSPNGATYIPLTEGRLEPCS